MYCTSRYPHETSAPVMEEIDCIMSRLETCRRKYPCSFSKGDADWISRLRFKKAFGVKCKTIMDSKFQRSTLIQVGASFNFAGRVCAVHEINLELSCRYWEVPLSL